MTAALTYIADDALCIKRRKSGRGFVYLCEDGERLTSEKDIKRIKALVIPPMWSDVYICKFDNGHIQAVGRDLKGRKQYIYHTDWEKQQQTEKFARMAEFGRKLPKLRRQVEKDLRKRSWCKTKVLALMVEILDETGIRIGNKKYERENQTYGLTTLRRKHLFLEDNQLLLKYKGKSNQKREISIDDRKLVRFIKEVSQLPGYELFTFLDENGKPHSVDSQDVKEYITGIIGEGFSCKDFRTWVGSRLAIELFPQAVAMRGEKPAKKLEPTLIKLVAAEMGNTASVCKAYYVHPLILEKIEAGQIPLKNPFRENNSPTALTASEKLLLRVLEG